MKTHRFSIRPGVLLSLVSVALLIALALGSLPIQARAAVTCGKYHTVVAGDTLSSIGLQYGKTYLEIAEANNLKEPYTLTIGMKLCIPGKVTSSGSSSTDTTKPADPNYEIAISRSGTRMTFSVSGFPAKANYWVNVGPAKKRGIDWTRLGKLRTNKAGEAVYFYRFPENLYDEPYVFVCMKNMVNDKLICKRVEHPQVE